MQDLRSHWYQQAGKGRKGRIYILGWWENWIAVEMLVVKGSVARNSARKGKVALDPGQRRHRRGSRGRRSEKPPAWPKRLYSIIAWHGQVSRVRRTVCLREQRIDQFSPGHAGLCFFSCRRGQLLDQKLLASSFLQGDSGPIWNNGDIACLEDKERVVVCVETPRAGVLGTEGGREGKTRGVS